MRLSVLVMAAGLIIFLFAEHADIYSVLSYELIQLRQGKPRYTSYARKVPPELREHVDDILGLEQLNHELTRCTEILAYDREQVRFIS